MSLRMVNPPVFLTIAQVKFNPVLDMGDFVSAIQKQWRATYPDFSQDTVNEVQIQMAGPGRTPQVKMNSSPRWNFKNIAKTCSFAVGTDFLTFQTTAYEDSDHFIGTLIGGLKVLHSTVRLAYTESLSIRMLDAIVASPGEDLAKYLKPNILSLASRLDGTCKQAISQLVMDGGDGQQLTAKLIRLNGTVGLPQELLPLPLAMSQKVRAINGAHVILDNDCIQAKRVVPLDLDDVNTRLRMLKAQLSKAFLETISEHAVSVWS